VGGVRLIVLSEESGMESRDISPLGKIGCLVIGFVVLGVLGAAAVAFVIALVTCRLGPM
jgi:hypothetical protein